ncbi:Sulfotransferase domain protein [Pseudodesulfovibrio hydrargyri]|uniref:Sulfotransferase domain protein n=1 Tax=Pseudodesulfovibrio hydrargyri TaxID=2125990 RepID=A0A1J5N5E8_9BACT|nr:sulfotransferase domain-containing protein [Pseudodesulfovibrio hydrargyri]OIQ50048.1 Sulfotransferase domain protein [Pseudodesulfovibrio hydrargyri]
MLTRCGINDYDPSWLRGLISTLRNTHELMATISRDMHSGHPVRVAVYGAGVPGWLAVSLMAEYPELFPVLYLDRDAARFREVDYNLNVLKKPALPVKTLGEYVPGEADVLLCATSPGSYADIIKDLDSHSIGLPRYFMHFNSGLDCIHERGVPFLLTTPGRCGTMWMRRMCRFLAPTVGYNEVHCINEDLTWNYESILGMRIGQYAVGHHEFTPELRAVIEAGELNSVYLFRDPRDIEVSYSFFSKRFGDTQRYEFDEDTYSWTIQHMRSWLGNSANKPVRFEDLKADPGGVMRQFCGLVGWEVDGGTFNKVVDATTFKRLSGRDAGQAVNNAHYRKGASGDWKLYYDESIKDRVKELSGDLLVELGYERDMDW